MHKEMKTNKKKAKYFISWLLSFLMARMKVTESAGLGLNAKPRSDLGQSELQPLSSVSLIKGKNVQRQQKVYLRRNQCGGRAKS